MTPGISGSDIIWEAYTVLPISRFTRRLRKGETKSVIEEDTNGMKDAPDRDDAREQYQEPKHIDIPLPPEAIQSDEDNTQCESHSAKNLEAN
jgi:hypothetical protein